MTRIVLLALMAMPCRPLADGGLKPYPFPDGMPTGPEAWTTADTVYQSAFLALMVVDWRQTLRATEGGPFYETNPLLPDRPARFAVHSTFFTVACLHALVSLALPPKPRRIWQAVSIGFEASSVAHNFSVGAGFKW
jgi:hypothetical protein